MFAPAGRPPESVPTHPMISPHSERGARRGEQPAPVPSPAEEGREKGGVAPPPTGQPVWDGPPPVGAVPPHQTPLDRLRSIVDRVSIRWRLTITYAVLFFVAGALLMLVIYLMVGWALDTAWPDFPVNMDSLLSAEEVRQVERAWYWQQHAAISQTRRDLLLRSLLALGGVGILAVIIGYVVADRALKPIQQMTATAQRLSGSTLAHERIDLQGPDDELKELADTFDAMLTRLNVAFDTQRRFVANASHELRTPLTINRTVLEIALSDPEASADLKALGRTLLEVNARNERLIEGLLLLARSERELSVRKPVDMKEVAQTAVEQLASRAEEAGVTVTAELRSAETVGDPVLLERCVSNLVENAIKHNLPESGHLWVRTGMVEGALVVQVANTGPHIPAYEVNSLFEPFRRLNADRVDSAKGAGLGLSIVRAVVRAHGGNVTAVPRDGGGLVVTVRLQSR
ncbi:signal transduction histidine kinase [Streptosporangium becharense]|uniref:histidine kinase n=1 Tax=Streptosporangium becharense TaxID=1816182 RepID=A0A7W9IL50_9ACTN|nr:HAMP domain-containing sensor histidine kinase [Streptosporangium becharense]MBB2911832.1 signal transduction histidine kinase [Streptosporangium becharense]MBB5822350.1 signal transduction histidine kinase [Streptosporangium becharense]